MVKKFNAFFSEFEGSLPRSQQPDTGPYSEPDVSSTLSPIPFPYDPF